MSKDIGYFVANSLSLAPPPLAEGPSGGLLDTAVVQCCEGGRAISMSGYKSERDDPHMADPCPLRVPLHAAVVR